MIKPIEGMPPTTFFGKLAMTILGACACALSAGVMLPVDRLNSSTVTALLLVGMSVYLMAALAQTSLTALLRRLLG